MRKIVSFLLAAVMLVSAVPAVFAAEICDWCGEDCGNILHDCSTCNYSGCEIVGCEFCNDSHCWDCFACPSCGSDYCATTGECISGCENTPEADINDYQAGTQVVYSAIGTESYTITVPAKLAPGQSGTVTLAGTWADNRVVTVTADENVTLVNSILESDTKTLKVTFDGISEAGDNTQAQTFTENVSVASIENALFGTWSGKFNYNVETSDATNQVNTPLKFGQKYIITYAEVSQLVGCSYVFLPNGDVELYYIDGSLEATVLSDELSYTQNTVTMDMDGDVFTGYISEDGKTITTYYLGELFEIATLESAIPSNPLRFGETYLCTLDTNTPNLPSEDGADWIRSIGEQAVFYQNGSFCTMGETMPEGTVTYTNDSILMGENVLGTISSDGMTLTFTLDYGVQVYTHVSKVDFITFSIDEKEYQAIRGMTWEEWVTSDYTNVDYFGLNGNLIFIDKNENCLVVNNVTRDDVIMDGHDYTLYVYFSRT